MEHYPEHSFGNYKIHSPTSNQDKVSDVEAGMPLASGNTLAQSRGVQGLSEGTNTGQNPLDTNLPLSSGADLRDRNSAVGVAGLQPPRT